MTPHLPFDGLKRASGKPGHAQCARYLLNGMHPVAVPGRRGPSSMAEERKLAARYQMNRIVTSRFGAERSLSAL